jgi:hypothetical protein
MFKHNRRQQERLQRAIEEGRRRGLDDETALRGAMREVVPEVPDEEIEQSDEPWRDDEDSSFGKALAEEPAREGVGFREAGDNLFEAQEKKRHPLQQKAMDLLLRLDTVLPDGDQRSAPALGTLYQGAGDVMGGLAQALSDRGDDDDLYGLRVVQLKRALRGAACARGVLFPLRASMSREHFDELYETLGEMEKAIFSELGRVRSQHRGLR